MKDIKDLPEIDDVVLPKIGSLRPGVYILTLAIIVVLLVVFLIGFLPGILNGGKFVNFTSEIDNVGVYVDGTYISGTPAQEFIKSGEHEVIYKKASQIIAKDTINVSHPVFLTYIFHRYQDVELELNQLNDDKIDKILNNDIQLIIDQSSILEFSAVTNYIPYFTQFAKDAKAFNLNESEIKSYLNLASSFISSIEMLNDAKEAHSILGIESTISLQKAQKVFEDDNTFIGNSFIDKDISATPSSLIVEDNAIINMLRIDPIDFVMGNSTYSSYPNINEAGINVSLNDSVYISKSPISNYLYSLFVVENPTWSKSNKQALIEQGLVDDNYLTGITLSPSYPSLEPIRNISYYASQAFCDWLSEKTNKEIYIPSEVEWSAAALCSTNYKENTYSSSLIATKSYDNQFDLMLGGVWEFTSTPYFALNRLIDDRTTIENELKEFYDYDIVVKGGSLLNSSVDINRVGAIDKSACFEYMGFRIAYKN